MVDKHRVGDVHFLICIYNCIATMNEHIGDWWCICTTHAPVNWVSIGPCYDLWSLSELKRLIVKLDTQQQSEEIFQQKTE